MEMANGHGDESRISSAAMKLRSYIWFNVSKGKLLPQQKMDNLDIAFKEVSTGT
jgi:hypothetical protein